MEVFMYELIQYGCDPCILNLVNSSWKYHIDIANEEVRASVRYSMPDKTLIMIIMMLIEAKCLRILHKVLYHVSVPMVEWGRIASLIDDVDVGMLLYSRVKCEESHEMARRIGLPIRHSDKDIWLVSSTLTHQGSIAGLTPMCSIIKGGYFEIFKRVSEALDDPQSVIAASIATLLGTKELFNAGIIKYIAQSNFRDSIPRNIHIKGTLPFVISMDIPYAKMENVPLHLLDRCGTQVLTLMVQREDICIRYIRSKRVSIRVLDAILRYAPNDDIHDRATTLVALHGWEEYLSIN